MYLKKSQISPNCVPIWSDLGQICHLCMSSMNLVWSEDLSNCQCFHFVRFGAVLFCNMFHNYSRAFKTFLFFSHLVMRFIFYHVFFNTVCSCVNFLGLNKGWWELDGSIMIDHVVFMFCNKINKIFTCSSVLLGIKHTVLYSLVSIKIYLVFTEFYESQ